MRGELRTVALAAAVVAATAAVAAGAAGTPALRVVSPGKAVTVGDRVTLRVEAVGGEGWLWGNLEAVAGDELRWAVTGAPRPLPDAAMPAWEVTVIPLQTGKQAPPELRVTVRPPDGDPVTAVPSEAPTIEVASVLPPDGDVKPAPLADPVGVVGFPWEWVGPAAAAVVPLVLLSWWLLRRRRRRRALEEVVRALPPLDELGTLIEELRAGLGRFPAAQLCDGLATGLRRFLERRVGAPALEMTSFEVRRLARRSLWPEEAQRALGSALNVADSVRFARRPAGESELAAALDGALAAARGLHDYLEAAEPSEAEAVAEATA